MKASVSPSTEAVASSMTRSRGLFNSARARQRSCRSPTEKLLPPSSTILSRIWVGSVARSVATPVAMPCCSCCGWSTLAKRTATKASKISSFVDKPNGSKHSRSVPAKRTGSCGMMFSPLGRPRTSDKPSDDRSMPSNDMQPDSISTNRNSAAVIVVLPAPVRPTTPHRRPGGTLNVKSFNANGSPSLYLMRTFLNSKRPCCGQSDGGSMSFDVVIAFSCGNTVMANARSRLVSAASFSDILCIMKLSVMVKLDDHMINNATSPGSMLRTSFKQTTSKQDAKITIDPRSSIRTPSQL
mmetsp:Transcript_3084/g.4417  ORF Transcript_3084/g.4417 Transcript_3084/m.4417 type:complete len:297 (+) Transcript_3084:643-1533(+)